jgi:predicted glycogen debranching enzyme
MDRGFALERIEREPLSVRAATRVSREAFGPCGPRSFLEHRPGFLFPPYRVHCFPVSPFERSPSVTQPLLHIDRDSCLQLERSMTREWIETDARGGYASSTILLCPTRRYHGLLVAPPPGQVKRHVFLARFEETFHGGGKSFPISMARYPGLWAPLGHQGVEHFELTPYPSWVYLFGRARLEREVMLVRGQHTVLVRYRVSGQQNPVELRLRPLLPFRDADALTFENFALEKRVERHARGIESQPYPALPKIAITLSGSVHFEADPVWYKNIEYPADIARGYDGHEEQFNPGVLHVTMESAVDMVVAATIGPAVQDPLALWRQESARRKKRLAALGLGVRAVQDVAADDFLHRDDSGRRVVIAGFPWFGEWGRDTYISLPGLLLGRGRVEECGEALESALGYLKHGLLPNIFGRTREESRYNSADAALWFARAVQLYEREAGAEGRVAERFLAGLTEIAESYIAGTDLGLRCDEEGLLHAGGPTLNATWMDAQTSAGPVTPRNGCAVELNALWYHLLAHLEELHRELGDAHEVRVWGRRKRLVGHAFLARFWLPDEHCLADTWNERRADRSLRPNMVIAAALEWSPLSRGMRTDVVKCAMGELLTPFGLRTLEPRNPAYVGRYAGNSEQRDRAYHQGTVWPWLIGFFCEAYLRAYGWKPRRIEYLRSLLDAFEEQLPRCGLNHVSEVFDGDPPHRPGGTIAQAWNTAEILRAYRLLEHSE